VGFFSVEPLMRARQIEQRDKDTEEARLHIERLRERNKELFTTAAAFITVG